MIDLQGKRILVTGATGFIGGNLAKKLASSGAQVVALVRNKEKARRLLPAAIELAVGDMTDAASLARAVKGCGIVFHCAGVLGDEFKPPAFFRAVNVAGTMNLALACLKEQIERFVHVSTVWVYGINVQGTITEKTPCRASGFPYCDTKTEGELVVRELVREQGLPAVIVQPTDIYGPGDETYVLEPIRLIRAGAMILPAGGRGLINALYIDDLVDGLCRAAQRGMIGERYILSHPESITSAMYFGALARIAGRETRLPSVPGWLALTAARIAEWGATLSGREPVFTREAVYAALIRARYDGGKAYHHLGFKPAVSFEDGMQRVAAWFATV